MTPSAFGSISFIINLVVFFFFFSSAAFGFTLLTSVISEQFTLSEQHFHLEIQVSLLIQDLF